MVGDGGTLKECVKLPIPLGSIIIIINQRLTTVRGSREELEGSETKNGIKITAEYSARRKLN